MPRDTVLFGLFIPSIVVALFLCIALTALLDRLLKRAGVYGFVAHPALFCISVFVILFTSISLYIYR